MLEDQIFCPSCGANQEHSLIKSGQENLVRCEECGTVHSIQREREPLVTLKVIVNKDDISSPYLINIPSKEELHVGDELLVDDTSRDVVMTEISSLETLETGRRVDKAPARAIRTVWARAIDEVPLKLSVYWRGKTNPLKVTLPGNEVLEVGEIREMKGYKFRIVKIKLRKEGFADVAQAKDVLRVWGKEL